MVKMVEMVEMAFLFLELDVEQETETREVALSYIR